MKKDNFEDDDDIGLEAYNNYLDFINSNGDKDIEDLIGTNYKQVGGKKKDPLDEELDKMKDAELSYEDQLFKQALKNYQGTDSEKYFLNKYIEYSFKKRDEEEEGFYLIGTNMNTIIDMIKDNFVDNIDKIDYPGKYKTKKEEEEQKKLILQREALKKEKQEQDGMKTYFERFNEYINENYNEVQRNIIGINKDISNVILQPEKVFNEESTFEQILEESRKYQFNSKNINLKSILNMVKVLFNKKKSLFQWLRVASLCETLYVYLNDGKTRELFFESITSLELNTLLDLEEFWKTDFLFRGNKEKISFRNNLDFYK